MKPEDIGTVLVIQDESGLSAWSFGGYLEELKRVDSVLNVAELGDEIIGFISARLITSKDGFGEAEILNIAVKSDMRKRGIGNELLQTVLAAVKSKKIIKIWLEVRESNTAARKFYEDNGFRVLGIRKNFYRNPSENAILMAAELI